MYNLSRVRRASFSLCAFTHFIVFTTPSTVSLSSLLIPSNTHVTAAANSSSQNSVHLGPSVRARYLSKSPLGSPGAWVGHDPSGEVISRARMKSWVRSAPSYNNKQTVVSKSTSAFIID